MLSYPKFSLPTKNDFYAMDLLLIFKKCISIFILTHMIIFTNILSASSQETGFGQITLEGMDYRTGSRVWRKQTYDTVYLTFGTLSGQRLDKSAAGADLDGSFLISAKSFPGAAYNCTMFNGSSIVYASSGSFSKKYTCPHDKRPNEISYVSTSSTLKRTGNKWSFDGNATIKGPWLSSNYDYVIKEKIEIIIDSQKKTCRLISYRRTDDAVEHKEDGQSEKSRSVTSSVKTVCTIL